MSSKFKSIVRKNAPSWDAVPSVYIAEPLNEKAPTIYVRCCTQISGPAKVLAQVAIRSQLFVARWLLVTDLLNIVSAKDKTECNYAIALAYVNISASYTCPVAVAVVNKNTGLASIFVQQKHRRVSVGSAIVEVLRHRRVEVKCANTGIANSQKFWKQNSVEIV